MSHLSQGFQGLWHLMTFPENQPLLGAAGGALTEMAKTPGNLSAAVTIGTKAFTALAAAHGSMLPEDKQIIPGIFQPALAELKTLADELAVQVNGRAATPALPADPALGRTHPIPAEPGVPGDPSKAPALAAAQKAYNVAEAAVKSALAAVA